MGVKVQPKILKNGLVFNTYKELGKHFNISDSKVKQLVNKYGMSLDDAVEKTIKDTELANLMLNNFGVDTVTKACKLYNVAKVTVDKRVKSGIDIVSAIKMGSTADTSITVNGIKYDSVKQACEKLGISLTAVYRKTKDGAKSEDVIIQELDRMKSMTIYEDSHGNKYRTIKELADAAGIQPSTCRHRLIKGWSVDRILSEKDGRSNRVKDHEDREFKSIDAMCKHWGINVSVYSSRIGLGWSVEKALTTPSREFKIQKIIYNNKTYNSMLALSKEVGIADTTLKARLAAGYTLEEAIAAGPTWKSIEILGTKFRSLKEVSKHFGIKSSTILFRFNNHIDMEIAATCSPDDIQSLKLEFISLDGIAYYRLSKAESKLVTTRQVIEKYRPDLLEAYDKSNPTGKYNPYIK